jgi:hypothetical protein
MKLKWLRRFLFFSSGFVLLIASLLFYLRAYGGRTLQREVSPNGKVIAEVIVSDSAGATDVNTLDVSLKNELNPIRHYVFGGLDYGAQVTVSWIDNDRLLIKCQHCENLHGGDIFERKWHDVMVCYARSNVVETEFKDDGKSCPIEP